MSFYMRAVLDVADVPAFDDLVAFVRSESDFRVKSIEGRDWAEFELLGPDGETVLAGDLWADDNAREELDELAASLAGLDGTDTARERVRGALSRATAIVGMQILMSVYDDSVAAANVIIDCLEQRPGVLTQVDTVGWYDGPDLVLAEPE